LGKKGPKKKELQHRENIVIWVAGRGEGTLSSGQNLGEVNGPGVIHKEGGGKSPKGTEIQIGISTKKGG